MDDGHGLLERYLAGEHDAVCEELAMLGPAVSEDPYRDPAAEIATEMMRRVRRNAELLRVRWRDAGWEFGYGWADEWARTDVENAPPLLGARRPDAAARLDGIERRLGPVPLVVRAFVAEVGSLNFVGQPRLPAALRDLSDEELLAAGWVWPGREECDPVQIDPDPDQLDRQPRDSGNEPVVGFTSAQPDPPGYRYLRMWPDRYHKYLLSGAGSYGTLIPQSGFDAAIHFNGYFVIRTGGTTRVLGLADPIPGWTFVGYLRSVLLLSGGFGVEPSGAGYRNQQFVEQLTAGLEPF